MFTVYQHWDPLKVCVVGISYPPEFYSWITVPHVRNLFEKIAQETEEDYQNIIKKLESFGVTVLRPELPENFSQLKSPSGKWQKPPMTPRDYTVMIGQEFYMQKKTFKDYYNKIRDPSWPDCDSWQQFYQLPVPIQQECINIHNINDEPRYYTYDFYKNISEYVQQHNTPVNYLPEQYDVLNGAMISRIGKDLYFGTNHYNQNINTYKNQLDKQFPNYRNHVVNTGGHSDATYCPVCPGLIISLYDVPSYANTYPGWEVVYLPNQSWSKVRPFLNLKAKNKGKWWIPGFEYDRDVVNVVETWLNNWTGYVEETVFDVNMLIIDPKNVIVFNYNKLVFDALERYGITPHIVPFRHRYFWDGGIHCVTSDLHREGTMQNYFPQRG
jgi:glycine amidinotransferase